MSLLKILIKKILKRFIKDFAKDNKQLTTIKKIKRKKPKIN